jgi:metal-responsive CopG/Arc/MetJ family transcriptional regulator
MRVKTSVTLPSSLLQEIDQLDTNRSAFLERAARAYLDRKAKAEIDAREALILERIADELNEEADALEYQALPV